MSSPPSTTRTGLGFIAAFALLAANAVVSYITLEKLVSGTRLVAQTEQAITLLGEVRASLIDAEAGQRNYVSTGDDRYLEPYLSARPLIVGKFTDLTRLIADDAGERGRLTALENLISRKFDGMSAAIDARRGQGVAAAALIQNPQGKALTDGIRRVIGEMQNREEVVLASRAAESEHNAYITRVTFVVATFLNICLFGGICFVVISDEMLRRKSAAAERESSEKVARSLAEVRERNQEITFLSQMSSFLQTCATSEEASKAIARFGPLLFPGEAGVIYLFHASRNYVEQTAAWGITEPHDGMFQPNECWALRRGRPHFVREQDNAMVCTHVARQGRTTLRPYACAPMMAQGETLGLLYLEAHPDEGDAVPLSEGKQQLVTAVAEQIALSLANLRLRETLRQQSVRDPLTGLYNRRFLEEALDRELARLERKNLPLALIMIDVDHFKTFNDTFGHEAGDAVLRDLGGILQRNVRGGDIACRYGGEEFTVIMPEANIEIARQRAEMLREATRELRLVHDGRSLGPVTLSLGVAAFPEHGRKREHLLQAADAVLYEAKNSGRNRVVVSTVNTLKVVENPQQRDQAGR